MEGMMTVAFYAAASSVVPIEGELVFGQGSIA